MQTDCFKNSDWKFDRIVQIITATTIHFAQWGLFTAAPPVTVVGDGLAAIFVLYRHARANFRQSGVGARVVLKFSTSCRRCRRTVTSSVMRAAAAAMVISDRQLVSHQLGRPIDRGYLSLSLSLCVCVCVLWIARYLRHPHSLDARSSFTGRTANCKKNSNCIGLGQDGRNVRWPRRRPAIPTSGNAYYFWEWRHAGQTDRQTGRHQTVALRLPL